MGIKRVFALVQIISLAVTAASATAATLARSFLNDTGGVVNDWEIFERNGNNTLVTVVSNGSPPTYTPLGITTQGLGNAATNQATLSGGNVPINGHISVAITIPNVGLLGNSGLLDWSWTNGGVRVGLVHRNAQAIFASITSITGPNSGNITVTATNAGDTTAAYTNFQFGTSAASVASPTYSTFLPPPPSGETILIAPTSFTLVPGGTQTFNLNNVTLSSFFDVFTDVSAGGESFFQFQESQVPEPGTMLLMGTVLCALGLWLLKTQTRISVWLYPLKCLFVAQCA